MCMGNVNKAFRNLLNSDKESFFYEKNSHPQISRCELVREIQESEDRAVPDTFFQSFLARILEITNVKQ
jgi:hypothetical protein